VVTDFGGTAGVATLHRVRFAKFAPFLLTALLSIMLAEVTARVYWRVCCGVPLLQPDQILWAYYPELRSSGNLPEVLHSMTQKPPAHGDGFYNILFLGGSVLHDKWGSVEMELREQLAYHGHRNVRIFQSRHASPYLT
jgi:hypothetical protein